MSFKKINSLKPWQAYKTNFVKKKVLDNFCYYYLIYFFDGYIYIYTHVKWLLNYIYIYIYIYIAEVWWILNYYAKEFSDIIQR